jgi:subtilisin family serine protease
VRGARLTIVAVAIALVGSPVAALAKDPQTVLPLPPAPTATDRSAALEAPALPDGVAAKTTCATEVSARLLVKFRSSSTSTTRTRLASSVGGHRTVRYRSVPGLELVSTSLPASRAAAVLGANPDVAYAEPDCIVHASATPNDPSFGQQWALHNTGQGGGTVGADVDIQSAWDVRTDASSVTVAVIDTGMQLDHPDLAANLWTNPGEIPGNGIDDDGNGYIDDVHGWDFTNSDADPSDDNGHGTHTSGTIGAVGDNGIGIAGVAWKVRLMPLKAFDANGVGSISTIISALDYAVANGAKIVNSSFGGPDFVRAEYDSYAAAGAAGLLLVAAAGNDGQNVDEVPHYPAAFRLSSVLSVAASTSDDSLASFSDYGVINAHVAAPGQAILSTLPGSTYGQLSGTSMATPHVSGVGALVAAEHPDWSGTQIRDRILGTTRHVPALDGKVWTGGVVDARAALSAAPTVLPPLPPLATGPLTASVVAQPNPPPVTSPTPPTWPTPSVIETTPAYVWTGRITLDGSGNPVIAYSQTRSGVHLATRQDGAWRDRTLSSSYLDLPGVGLATGKDGVPVVAIERVNTSPAKYADPGILLANASSPDATVSRLTAACPDADSCHQDDSPSIAADVNGALHMVFTRIDPLTKDWVKAPAGSAPDVAGKGLYYATDATGSWVFTQLTSGSSDGPAALALAPDGTVHVVLKRTRGSASGLYEVTSAGGTWTESQLTNDVEDSAASIAVDTTGAVHVAFARPGMGLYLVERPAGGEWGSPARLVDATVTSSTMAADASGHLHIAYGRTDAWGLPKGVSYLTNASGAWSTSVVDGGRAHDPSLALDSSGQAHIAYSCDVDGTSSGGIFYATNASGSFERTLVRAWAREDITGGAYVVDSFGHHHVVINEGYGGPSAGVWYGTDAAGSWAFTQLSSMWPMSVGLAVDSGGHGHVTWTSFQDGRTGAELPPNVAQLWYATNATGAWHADLIPTADYPWSATIATGPDDEPFIVWAGWGTLYSAELTGSGWTTRPIIESESVRDPQLLRDTAGVYHLVADATNAGQNEVRYWRGSPLGWSSVARIPTSDSFLFPPSIAVAPNGDLWIASWHSRAGVWAHRIYQTSPGAFAVASTEVAPGSDDMTPGIAVDAAGIVHVAYTWGVYPTMCSVPLCVNGPGIYDAVYDGSAWTTTQITPLGLDSPVHVAASPNGEVSLAFGRLEEGWRHLVLVPKVTTATLALQAGSDTGASASDRVTNAPALTFDVIFDRAVTGLTASDFTVSGTATGCLVGSPAGTGSAWTVVVSGCGNGTVTLGLAANAVSDGTRTGPWTAVAAAPVKVDRVAPTVRVPTITFRSGATVIGTQLPISLAWTGDEVGSSIAGYRLERSSGGGIWTTVSTKAVSPARFGVASSGTSSFRVRATDLAGNVGAYAVTTVSPSLVEDRSSSIHYSGTWWTQTSSSFSGNTSHYATAGQAAATFTFTGRGVALVTRRSTTEGKVCVVVDGLALAILDLKGSTAWRWIPWGMTWPSVGTHTIRLEVLGTAGRPRVDLDAFAVLH